MLYNWYKGVRESETQKNFRKPTYLINPLILNRWSPRAMTGEEIVDSELMSLFEAARWVRTTDSHGTQREIQKVGIDSLT